jgi:hypothetical protein
MVLSLSLIMLVLNDGDNEFETWMEMTVVVSGHLPKGTLWKV